MAVIIANLEDELGFDPFGSAILSPYLRRSVNSSTSTRMALQMISFRLDPMFAE
jgi:hypothetical protein